MLLPGSTLLFASFTARAIYGAKSSTHFSWFLRTIQDG